MKIVLIGFAAAGKTETGKIVARKLKRDFVDVDEEITKLSQESVSDLFGKYGEQYFRQLESEVLKKYFQVCNAVISCGGGSALSPLFQDFANNAAVVWLKVTPQTVYKRLGSVVRPLFDGLSLRNLELKMKERNAIYGKYASLIVDTDALEPEEVADEIIKKLYLI